MLKKLIREKEKMKKEKLEKKSEEKKVEEPVKRTSINSIPLPDINQILKQKFEPKEEESKEEIKKVDEKTELCGELCSSYKFVVNYGVFEQNFEWLPQEVSVCYVCE
jgi:FMN-dependent NADH-azoreductase